MVLLTTAQQKKMFKNGQHAAAANERGELFDPRPVVKLFTPDGAATWLLSEISPTCSDIAFGLCDLGVGFPELGSVSLREIEDVRGPFGLPVKRDTYFIANKTLLEYAKEAHRNQKIFA